MDSRLTNAIAQVRALQVAAHNIELLLISLKTERAETPPPPLADTDSDED